MSDELTTGELAELISWGGPFSAGSSITADELIESLGELLRHNAHPEFKTVMASESVTQEYPGIEGFEEAWTDWIYPYESFRIALDKVLRREDRLVFLVRQIATTRHSGVEVETSSAAVWWLEDAQIRQAAFYLDQHAGLRAAGIDPDRPSGE